MATGLYIGMMSGTSLDGVDTVIMDFSHSAGKMLASQFTPMPDSLRQSLAELCRNGSTTLQNLGQIDHDLGVLYAECALSLLKTAQYKPEDITAIGCHGQTVWHSPQGSSPFTMQIGDANIIAARTGVTTIADFRRKDMALGGQGAPLVPAYHQVLFTVPDQLTVILNIGGISNISVLPPDANASGYDTGPGNVLLDAWIEHHQGQRYDKEGAWAKQGSVNEALLTLLLQTPFFALPAPKSTGRELFNLPWLQDKLTSLPPIAPVDVQSTLVELTARSIAEQIVTLPYAFTRQSLLVCGGGAKNPLLMARLRDLLPDWQLGTTTASGLDIDYVEAAAFAWLAYQRLHNLPSNVPAVTGALRAIPLGVIYPGDRPSDI